MGLYWKVVSNIVRRALEMLTAEPNPELIVMRHVNPPRTIAQADPYDFVYDMPEIPRRQYAALLTFVRSALAILGG